MKIFLTGGSGFVGGAIGKRLSSAHQVLALARSERAAERITKLGLEPVRGELNEVSARQLSGVEVVIHAAAKVEAWGRKADFWHANVEGTTQLLAAAREAGVRRFVHISTEQAVFSDKAIVNGDESLPYPVNQTLLYSSTKSEAEQRVLASNSPTFETLALRPRLVWGPGDQTIGKAAVEMVRSGRFRWIDQGNVRTSTTFIDNFVHAVNLALDRGRGGQVYFITDDTTRTFREFLSRLMLAYGVTPPEGSMPSGAARALASIVEALWGLFRIQGEPPITRMAVAIMSHECTVSIEKARRELGYEPLVTFEAGLLQVAAHQAATQ
jgi:nucleoside-diphosphate-sugar epimerase